MLQNLGKRGARPLYRVCIVLILVGLAWFTTANVRAETHLNSDDVYVALSDGTKFVGTGIQWSDYFCTGAQICKTGDVNGDGRDDLIAFVRTTHLSDDSDVYVALSTGSSFGPLRKWHDYFCTLQEICEVGDVNGDGKADILAFVRTNNGANDSDVYVALSTGTSFGAGQKWHDYFCTLQEICKVGDVNGDGKVDILAFVRTNNGVGDSDVWVALSDGTKFGAGQKWHDYFCTLQEICAVADVNGDGKADAVAFVRTNNGVGDSDVWVALSDGTRFGAGQKWHDYFCTLQEICALGDVNGDGKADAIAFVRTNNGVGDSDVWVALSDGTKFGPGQKWHDYFCTLQEICGVGDFNGDGKDDVVTFVRGRTDNPVTTQTLNVSISMWWNPTDRAKASYTTIFEYFADAIFEMSNGAHRVGTITVYPNRVRDETADVVWTNMDWPHAPVAGRGHAGDHLYFADIFFSPDPDGTGPATALGPYFALNAGQERGAGYTLAHEWGHFYYGIYDEYRANRTCDPRNPTESDITDPWACDVSVQPSVMTSQWNAKNGDYTWLNFSIAANQTSGNPNRRVYGVSGWETLVRDPKNDPKDGARKSLTTRAYYPELKTVAPTGSNRPTIELPNSESRAALRIVWVPPTANKQTQTEDPYLPRVIALDGDAILYPAAGRLVASVGKSGGLITKADVSASVVNPDATTTTLTFTDDGVAPDARANDGLYSALLPYTQPGAHQVEVHFTNPSLQAEIVYDHYHFSPGPNGETVEPGPKPVGEDFDQSASVALMVSGFRPGFSGVVAPTQLTVDNRDFPGRIDMAGDKDSFTFYPETSDTLVLRVTDLALGMQPKVRVYRGDPAVLIGEYTFTPWGNDYFFTKLEVEAGERYLVEVEHQDPSASEGLFNVSVGPALANTLETAWRLFLPLIRQAQP
ncbi:MAG: VCBS repeat-containing protein [Anaerolineae bacterium]|nr:VCBS repeat-containing protein [Anaerolineae bacterium]